MIGSNYNAVNGYNHIKAGPEAERLSLIHI